jgi:uncharacterized protein (DUF1786 family)
MINSLESSILVIDIGGGTQDILIYDQTQPLENAVKLVIPSPTVMAARRLAKATTARNPVFLSGRVMGGGAVGKAVRRHLQAGLPVYSLMEPALTFHDRLEKVEEMGIEITTDPPAGAEEIILGDLDLPALAQALAAFEVELPSNLALAIQDHGFSPTASNRLTRFAQWQRFLEAGGDLDDLLFDVPPPELTRWQAAAESAPGACFMDTASAALRGAILDDYAAGHLARGLLVINVGNEHTVAFLVRARRVWGVYEHHTSLLNREKLADHMAGFARGQLSHQEIFDDWGHGVAYYSSYDPRSRFEPAVVTGPRRALAVGLGHLAAPFGEMMLSGCFGLVAAMQERLTP